MLFRLPLLKRLVVLFTLLIATLCWLTLKRSDPGSLATPTTPNLNDAYGKLPLQFEPNEGQAAADVEFLTRGSNYTLSLKQTEAVLSLSKQDVRLKFLDGNPAARISASDVLPGKVNHFIGNDPAKWRTNISTYKKVKYQSVYPGIDLIYYGDQGRLEYDFIVAPGSDPQSVQLSFPEAQELRIDRDGALIVKVQDVELRQPKPLIYQETATGRRIIDGHYILKNRESFAFQIDDYDRKEPLIIDPTLTYSTMLGTTSARSIAVDNAGNAYITGQIDSDFYVFKLNPSGTALIYTTLIGGTLDEESSALAVDSSGNVYVTGITESTDFPTTNAIQSSSKGAADAFVTKINSSGTALVYSTYLGGNQNDGGSSIEVNSAGNAFIVGSTGSTDFPVANALQPTKAPGTSFDIFVSKINSTGNALVYSTYIGGSDSDRGLGLALDSEERVYITGDTDSLDFPTTNDARLPTARGPDTFLIKLSSAGNALLYSSYHGGGGQDLASGITVHSDGSIYVTGLTFSTDFPLVNALQSTPHFTNLFITKFDSLGKSIIYSTFLGGDGFDVAGDLTTDSSGNLYITGRTSSSNFPLVQPLQNSLAGAHVENVFVSKLNPSGSALLFSTYLGSSISDLATSIAVRNGSIFVTGNTFGSRNFPVTPGAFQQNNFEEDGHVEGFAFRIDSTPANYYSISGRVTERGLPMSEILITLSGGTSRIVRTDFDGRYSFHVLAEGRTYTVTATPRPGFSFSPPSRTFTNINANQPGADFVVPRPPNDDFSNAQVISDTSGVINGTTAGATLEPGETLNGGASVWYRWQASNTGRVILNLTQVNATVLEVFTGSSVDNLTNVSARFTVCDFPGCSQSAASFKSIAGTVYFIRVAGSGVGNFGFNFSPGGPTISGRVKNVNGRSLSGITVKATLLGQDKITQVTTTEDGYSLIVPAGVSYSVVAVSSPVDSFVPVQLNNLNQDASNVDFTASSPTVNIFGSISNLNEGSAGAGVTATGAGINPIPCNRQASTFTLFFSCFVPIFGDYTITPSAKNYIFNPSNRFFSGVGQSTSGADFSATAVPAPPLQLIVEGPGPVPDLVLALDAQLWLRDPFAVVNPLNLLNNSSDKNTRLVIFLQHFQPILGEPPSEVVVNLVRGNQSFDVLAEDVRSLANTDMTQVTFRLPDGLSTGEYMIKVRAHGETTNSATLRIGP